ncbi:MAG: von Willebrand factor type [Planctomycetaceae bacterium]|nr:von Willebrand factor type [Planctomycetaceae bacterium]
MSEEFILECKLDQPAILAGQSTDLYSLVTIRPNLSKLGALLETAGETALPAHLIVVVDVSGSMAALIEDDPDLKVVGQGQVDGKSVSFVESNKPSRQEVAIRVVQRLMERMGPEDRMTLTAFDHTAYSLAKELPPGPELRSAIQRLADTGGGGTSMGRALQIVKHVLGNKKASSHTQRIVVLTDGEDQEADLALGEAFELGNQFHVPIFAFGTGASRGDFLLNLCKATLGGAYRDIANEQQAEDCFSEFLTTQKNILATNVALQLWLSPEIFVRELYRTKPEILFVGDMQPDASNTVRIAIEYMEKNKAYEFLFRCTVPPHDTGRFRLAKACLLYDLPTLGLVEQRAEANIAVEFTNDADRALVRVGDVRKVIGQAEVQRQLLFLQQKRDALAEGRATEKDRTVVARLLDQLIRRFEEHGDQASVNMYSNMKDEFLKKGLISQEMINRSLAASSKVEGTVAVQEIDDF